MFRAIVVEAFGAPEVLNNIKECARVLLRSTKDVRVRVLASGVNPVDAYIRSGNYAALPQLPYTPGSDGAGEVLEVGEEVSNVRVGDRVWISGKVGTCAEECLVSEDQLFTLPANVTL